VRESADVNVVLTDSSLFPEHEAVRRKAE